MRFLSFSFSFFLSFSLSPHRDAIKAGRKVSFDGLRDYMAESSTREQILLHPPIHTARTIMVLNEWQLNRITFRWTDTMGIAPTGDRSMLIGTQTDECILFREKNSINGFFFSFLYTSEGMTYTQLMQIERNKRTSPDCGSSFLRT